MSLICCPYYLTQEKKATPESATADGWVISENKGVADMSSGRSAPEY